MSLVLSRPNVTRKSQYLQRRGVSEVLLVLVHVNAAKWKGKPLLERRNSATGLVKRLQNVQDKCHMITVLVLLVVGASVFTAAKVSLTRKLQHKKTNHNR